MKQLTIRILTMIWVAAFILGLIGLLQKFTTGERLTGYGSYVPWGLWVAIYFHAIGIAGGAFAVGATGYLLNIKGLKENLSVIVWISIVGIVTGMFAIWLDLGKMWRFYRILTDPSFTSMLAFNAWMYIVFIVNALICFTLSRKDYEEQISVNRQKSSWLVPLLMLGIVMSCAFPSQSGAFLGVIDAKPYWSSALMPVMFLASAVASGAAVLLFVFTFIFDKFSITDQPFKYLRRVTIIAVMVYLGLEFAEFSVALWSPSSHAREAFDLILLGPFWWVFWIVHLGGALLALFLLFNKSIPSVGTGAFLVAFTFISTRLNVLIPGQSVSELKGLEEAFTHSRLSHYYQATQNEYFVALFLGAFGVALLYLGLKKFAHAGLIKEVSAS